MIYTVELAGVSTRWELHQKIKESLQFPDYYGNNLDALYDCLTENREERTVLFLDADRVDEELFGYLLRLRRVCQDVSAENPALTIRFMVEEKPF